MVSHAASSNQVGEGRWKVFSEWARICFEDRRSRSQPAGVRVSRRSDFSHWRPDVEPPAGRTDLRASILANRERYKIPGACKRAGCLLLRDRVWG